MSTLFHTVTRRSVTGLASLGLLTLAVVVSKAQDARTEEQSVTVILNEFQKAWNDEAWGPMEGRVGKYMRPMDDVGWKRRMAVLQMIVRNGRQEATDLEKALDSETTSVRSLAAQALGYCGNAGAQPALAHIVEHDADAMVRLYAADSLGMLGGRDYDELLRRLEPSEKNRDTKRHIGYALDREGRVLDPDVARGLRQWDIANLGSAALNQPAPDFELTSLDGQQVRLSKFRGTKSVVLVFVYGDT